MVYLNQDKRKEVQMMKRLKRYYTVSKCEKSGLWYAHKAGFPWIPVLGTFSKTKREAQKRAAELMGISLEYYLQLKEVK